MPVFLILFAVVSLAAAIAAVRIFLVKQARYRRWHRTQGKVLELIRHKRRRRSAQSIDADSPMKGTPIFAPRVSFQTTSGESGEFVSSVASNLPPAVGESIDVIYDPEDPPRP